MGDFEFDISADASRLLGDIPKALRKPLLNEFNKILKNYREHRWEPAELNAGKLSEVIYSILDGYTSGKYPESPAKPPNFYKACRQLEQLPSAKFTRSVRVQIPRLLTGVYEIRNNRNVGHVGGEVDPNHQDAEAVVAISQWMMAELIRIFHDVDIEAAAEAVDYIVERRIPLIWEVNGRIRVLNPSLSAKDKTLAILYSEKEALPVDTLLEALEYKNHSRYRNKVLSELHSSRLIEYDRGSDSATISPLGVRYVEDELDLSVAV